MEITNNNTELIEKQWNGKVFKLLRVNKLAGFNASPPVAIILNPEEARKDAEWTLSILKEKE
jgi:hypothetical protein